MTIQNYISDQIVSTEFKNREILNNGQLSLSLNNVSGKNIGSILEVRAFGQQVQIIPRIKALFINLLRKSFFVSFIVFNVLIL